VTLVVASRTIARVHSLQDETSVRRILADVLGDDSFVERVEISQDGASVTLWTQRAGVPRRPRPGGPPTKVEMDGELR